MNKKFMLLIVSLLVNSSLMANDCVFFAKGNQLVPSEEEKDISVKKEILTLSLQDNGFTKVNVYYELDNKSSSPNVYMFPIDTDFKVRVAHNLPYAHRGYVFSKPELKSYFEQFWWYMPDPDYKPNTEDFTEKDNDFIKIEKSKE